jgi:hypothetical protein
VFTGDKTGFLNISGYKGVQEENSNVVACAQTFN